MKNKIKNIDSHIVSLKIKTIACLDIKQKYTQTEDIYVPWHAKHKNKFERCALRTYEWYQHE